MNVGIEEARVDHQRWMRLQELSSQRLRSILAHDRVALDLVDREQPHPLLALGIVGGDLRVELFRDAVRA